jgi:acetyltransferase
LSVIKDEKVYKILILTPQTNTDVENIVKTMVKNGRNDMVAVLIGGKRFDEARETLAKNGIPVFQFPERAVKALGTLVNFTGNGRSKKENYIKGFGKVAEKLVSKGSLDEAEIAKLLNAYHVPVAESYLTLSANEAIKITETVKYPVALKIVSPDIFHKTETGGVKLDIKNDTELRSAYQEILKSVKKQVPKAEIRGISLSRMEIPKFEIALGAKRDPIFGPIVMFGMGGIYIEVFRDFCFGLAPVSVEKAKEMIESVKLYPLLAGVRSQKAVDIDGIAKALSGLSALLVDFDRIKEIDINPLKANPGEKILALDAKIIFE